MAKRRRTKRGLTQAKLDWFADNAKKIAAAAAAYKKHRKEYGKLYSAAWKVTSKKLIRNKVRRRRTFRTRVGRGGRAINVKNDKEGQSRTFYVQKVTDQQQKRINKRFKDEYSAFKDEFENGFQETIPQATGKCKWIWRCYNNLQYLGRAFEFWPDEGTSAGQPSGYITQNSYQNSETQAVYFNKFKTTYEIYNPTNYDMNLIIYDIVVKQDTDQGGCANTAWNTFGVQAEGGSSTTDTGSPIWYINKGLSGQSGYYPSAQPQSSDVTVVADTNDKTIFDIQTKPTESYPFNIYFTIVKKHIFKLQPGATMTHKFIHKPKALLTRGYWGYKYAHYTNPYDSKRYMGIKDITSGCLFKFWGQVAGTATSTGTGPSGTGEYSNMTQAHHDVTTLSGRLMFKEYVQNRWYCCNPKYTYNWKTYLNNFKPSDEEVLPIVNDEEIKGANDDIPEVDNNTAN